MIWQLTTVVSVLSTQAYDQKNILYDLTVDYSSIYVLSTQAYDQKNILYYVWFDRWLQ